VPGAATARRIARLSTLAPPESRGQCLPILASRKIVVPADIGSELPTPAYSAFYQWVAELRGFVGVKKLLSETKAPAALTADLLLELSGVEEAFGALVNREQRHLGKIQKAYKALNVHWWSDWEQSEVDVLEGLAAGTYDAWESASARLSVRDMELFLLVLHGGFEKAVPLLERHAREKPETAVALWSHWLATGRIDEPLLKTLLERAQKLERVHDLPLFFIHPDQAAAEQALVARTAPKERELAAKPVKSMPKLLSQLLALRAGTLSAAVVRKSFASVYAACYHHESYSDLKDKIALACLQGRYLDADATPRSLVEGIKQHLAMFSPKRRAQTARFVKDVAPVMNVLQQIRQVLTRQQGIRIVRGEATTRIEPHSV
jgi:hypothetical protein